VVRGVALPYYTITYYTTVSHYRIAVQRSGEHAGQALTRIPEAVVKAASPINAVLDRIAEYENSTA
jgi:hypothetical protein